MRVPVCGVDGTQDPASNQLKTFSWKLSARGLLAWAADPAMAFRGPRASMIQALAMTVAEIPVFLYTTFGAGKDWGGCGPSLYPTGP